MKYYFRLDDACEKMNTNNWNHIEEIFDKNGIIPLVGIIPNCLDKDMDKYSKDIRFWDKARKWQDKNWVLALHGYTHVCDTNDGGINPVHKRSEYAGKPMEEQKALVRKGLKILNGENIFPKIFFAPSHTFDENTLKALEEESDIRVISDTIARERYTYNGFTFVPQQSGRVRKLRLFKEVTFCYHPNTMTDKDFDELESFIIENKKFIYPYDLTSARNKKTIFDRCLSYLYFRRRKKNTRK